MASPIRAHGTFIDGGKYTFASNVGAAVVSINPGTGLAFALLTVAAFCSGPGATITIQVAGAPAYPTIPIPPGGAVSVDLDGGIVPAGIACDVTFTGTDGYFVDWVQEIP